VRELQKRWEGKNEKKKSGKEKAGTKRLGRRIWREGKCGDITGYNHKTYWKSRGNCTNRNAHAPVHKKLNICP
jgi:hypothetical protein